MTGKSGDNIIFCRGGQGVQVIRVWDGYLEEADVFRFVLIVEWRGVIYGVLGLGVSLLVFVSIVAVSGLEIFTPLLVPISPRN